MTLFTHNVKMIRSAVHENGDVDGTCKHDITVTMIKYKKWQSSKKSFAFAPYFLRCKWAFNCKLKRVYKFWTKKRIGRNFNYAYVYGFLQQAKVSLYTRVWATEWL